MRWTTACAGLALCALLPRSASAQAGVEPPAEAPAAGAAAPAPPPEAPLVPTGAPLRDDPTARVSADDGRLSEYEKRLAESEARIQKLEARGGGILKHLTIQAYVQVQFMTQSVNEAASPNLQQGRLPEGIGANDVVAKADGTTTNATLFRLRRTRLRFKYELDFLRVYLQLEPFPSGGPTPAQGTIARGAEVTGILRWTKDVRTEIGAGMFEVPFRFELLESNTSRPFLERSWASTNLFPAEHDIGVHAKTIALGDKLVVDAGILNGVRLGEPHFVELPDMNRSKDFFARAAYKLGPFNVGVFGYLGRGSHVDAKDLRFKTFPRKAVNFGVQYAHSWSKALGETRAYGELLFGQNMDTGVRYAFALPAIPANVKDDVTNLNERALTLRAEQDLVRADSGQARTVVPFAGFRYDTYTPDTSIANNARDTYTLMAGVNVTKQLRIVNEGSYIIDNAHASGGPPPSRHIVQYSLWMQGGFF